MAGADVGDWLVSRGHVKTVEQATERDRESFVKMREHTSEMLIKNVEELAKDYPSFPKKMILKRMLFFGFKSETIHVTHVKLMKGHVGSLVHTV